MLIIKNRRFVVFVAESINFQAVSLCTVLDKFRVLEEVASSNFIVKDWLF
jgi:hypothetical protein